MTPEPSLSIKVQITWGTEIGTAAEEMIHLANRLAIKVTSEFNGVFLNVTPYSNKKTVVAEFERRMSV